jgi:tetratricopeptide (TPR) repeat protein
MCGEIPVTQYERALGPPERRVTGRRHGKTPRGRLSTAVGDYPQSWNVWDSLGEGYKVAGNRDKAIESYRKSMQLNPANTNGVAMLRQLGIEWEGS